MLSVQHSHISFAIPLTVVNVCVLPGRQVPHSGAKSTAIDIPSLGSPGLGATTTVTTIFQQPIMSPAPAPLAPEPIALGKEDEEVEEEEVKKESDEEPMETAAEKQDEVETEEAETVAAEAEDVSQILTEIVQAKMTSEDLRPMDTDKESLGESKSPEMSVQEDSGSDIAPMQTDEQLHQHQLQQQPPPPPQLPPMMSLAKEPIFVPGPNEKPLYTAEALTLDDLTLLAELFYLPYEHGPKAAHMLKEFNWLRANSSTVSINSKDKDPEKVSGCCSY